MLKPTSTNFLLLTALLLPISPLRAADPPTRTLYVDFDNGADTNPGLVPDKPLKHSPGDPNATDIAKSTTLQPGDTILFKGGITYRGNIVVPASGNEHFPITFAGTPQPIGTTPATPATPAVIDGSEIITTWQPCASAEEAAGNLNWKKIYHATLAAPIQPFASNMYQNDKMLWPAQDPNPADPFYQDRPEGHRKIASATANSITDEKYFTQADKNALDGAWVIVYASPNYPYFLRVTGYDPAAHAITHSGKLTKPSSFALLNSLSALDTPGEYVIKESADKKSSDVFLWPLDEDALKKSGASISRLGTAFDINGKKHINITGFTIQKFVAAKNTGMGVEINKSDHVTISGNTIRFGSHSRTGGVSHGAGINVTSAQDILLQNNQILDNRRCSGIIANPATNVITTGNTVRKTGYCGIWYMHVKDSQILGNTVTDNEGVHANAISIYADSGNILVANNQVYRSERPLTLQDSPNIVIVNNVLLGDGGPALGLWNGKPQTKITVINNLILNTKDGEGIYAVNKVLTDCLFQNNIMGTFSGEAAIDNKANKMQNNIYLSANQGLFDPSEKHAKAEDLFTNPEKEDYHPKPASPAKDAGATPTYPTEAWPKFDFTKDAANNPRTTDKSIDIGPYESK